MSPDPLLGRDAAITNPQLWNLYAYCRNSPVTFIDPDGREESEYQQSTGFAWVDQKIEAAWHWISDKLMPNESAASAVDEDAAEYQDATGVDPSTGAAQVKAGFKDATETIGSEFTKTAAAVLIAGSLSRASSAIPQLSGYTKHGLNQAISRDGVGVSSKAILSAVKTPLSVIRQSNGTVKLVGKDAVVILNEAGQVVTTWATSIAGQRTPR